MSYFYNTQIDDVKFERYVKLLENGTLTLKQLEERELAHFVRHYNLYARAYEILLQNSIQTPPFAAWISGPTGTGKTYAVEQLVKSLAFDICNNGVEHNFYNSDYGKACGAWDECINLITRVKIVDNSSGKSTFYRLQIQVYTSLYELNDLLVLKKDKNAIILINKLEQIKRRVSYSAIFKNNNDSTTTSLEVPPIQKVHESSGIVLRNLLGVYKQFLYEKGYRNVADSLSVLKNVVPPTSTIKRS